ncbi:MAG TPA: TIGR03435 family protein [Bryobacteraceae bacterium]|jgi:uncharacterized protein (TIGR03435 family)|nr:TIGR03435 family protein [Bryobacteraceae bacterium]
MRLAGITLILLATLHTPLTAQSEQAGVTFEVASVHHLQGNVYRAGPLTIDGPLVRLQGYTIFGLVMDAWHLSDYQIEVSPDIPKDDVYNKMYDIVARAPGSGAPSPYDVRIMLRNLLADRFRLTVHAGKREMQVYLMRVAKNGLKLQASSSSESCRLQTGVARDGRNDEEIFSGCPLERLAERLRGKLDRPVLDRTGLRGQYEMHLVAAPESRTLKGPDPADIDPRTAVRDMGLTLTPAKASVDVIVVDRLERLTEN